jgi:hypothetical protein
VVVARPTKIISLLKSEEQEWNNAPKDFLMNKVLYYGVLAIQEELGAPAGEGIYSILFRQ